MLPIQICQETIASAQVKYGGLATGAAAARITSDHIDLKFGAIITAADTNTAAIFVGDAYVTAGTGFPLAAGATLKVPVEELEGLYAISVAAQDLNWIGY